MVLFVLTPAFELTIVACICINTLVMAMARFPSDETWDSSLNLVGNIFAGVFFIECVMKLVCFQGNYFKDNWNIFDFLCVASSLVGITFDNFGPDNVSIGPVTSVVRIFRIGRLFRLLRFAKGLNKLFNAFLMSLPKLVNVGCILSLLLFLYAVLGMNIFAKVRFYGPHDDRGNFRSFYRAFMTLCRCMTGEAWNEVMHALGKSESARLAGNFDEADNLVNQCGASVLAQVYFLT